MPSVLLVRHGQASFGGPDYDVLSDTGHRQAAAVADELRARGVRVDRLVCGGLARQRDTAAPLAEWLGVPAEVDARWDEYRTEDLLEHHSDALVRESRPAGSPAPEISSRDFQAILETALLDWIGAGPDGPADEPYPAFAGRVGAALGELADGLGSGETAVVCTSGGVLAAVCVELLGVPPQALVPFNRVAVNGAITKLAHGRSGTTLVSFNEHGHLENPDLVTYR
jgi:broad specificity phosphatase PhoE